MSTNSEGKQTIHLIGIPYIDGYMDTWTHGFVVVDMLNAKEFVPYSFVRSFATASKHMYMSIDLL